MKLQDVVGAIVRDQGVTPNEIVATVLYLLQDDVCQDQKTLFKIWKSIKDDVEYERHVNRPNP